MTFNTDNFNEEFDKEARKHATAKSMADVVGLPDNEDKERIRKYLVQYEKKHPGEIGAIVAIAREDFRQQGGRVEEYGEVNKQAHGRTLFELPENLGRWMDQAYPLMFKSREHTLWFAKNFPELLIPRKY